MLINYAQIYENSVKKRLPSSVWYRIERKALPRKIDRYLPSRIRTPEIRPVEKWIIYASTDRGTKQDNEDSFCIYNVDQRIVSGQSANESYEVSIDIKDSQCLLLAVADGISSLPQSQKASSSVIQKLISSYPTITLENGKYIKRGLQGLNRNMSKTDQGDSGAALAMALLDQNKAYCANIGDSAVYHIHNNRMQKISVDDTVAQEMMEEGILSHQISESLFHTLTQYIGQIRTAEPHLADIDLAFNDALIIMSDAFEPDEETVLALLRQDGNIAGKMIRHFRETRSDYYMDNSTVVIAVMK